jgi:perosamine synthetase
MSTREELALFGGPKAVTIDQTPLLRWPQMGIEEVQAVLRVMQNGEMSITNRSGIIAQLEDDFAAYEGVRFALARNSGTAALHCGYFAVGVSFGDEVIVPSYTWLATVTPLLQLGAIPVFADVDPLTLTIDPADIERKITAQTKAVVPVHMWGHPADMDRINAIARDHNIKVVEDASHAHGSLYKGRKTGTLGDIGCFSMQASKSMTAGEGGILVTNERIYYERAMVLSQSPGRLHQELTDPQLQRFANTGLGLKYRIHGIAAALADVQLKKLDSMNAVRNHNHNRLTAQLQGLPGITPPYTASDCYRGAWYEYRMIYDPTAFVGPSPADFVARLQAEGVHATGERYPMQHIQTLYSDAVLFEEGLPWGIKLPRRRIYNRQGDLPVIETLFPRLIAMSAFPNMGSDDLIDQYAAAIRKVVYASINA